MEVQLTDHARARMQQRGIRAEALEALLDHGQVAALHSRGREIVYFGRNAKGYVDERASRTYAILGRDGKVITVGHRYRRVRRT